MGLVAEANAALDALKAASGAHFITKILLHQGFRPSDERFHNYYAKDQTKPFCQSYIDPKLVKLRQNFSALLKD